MSKKVKKDQSGNPYRKIRKTVFQLQLIVPNLVLFVSLALGFGLLLHWNAAWFYFFIWATAVVYSIWLIDIPWAFEYIEISDMSLNIRKDLFTAEERSIEYGHISDIEVESGLLRSIFNFGTIEISLTSRDEVVEFGPIWNPDQARRDIQAAKILLSKGIEASDLPQPTDN